MNKGKNKQNLPSLDVRGHNLRLFIFTSSKSKRLQYCNIIQVSEPASKEVYSKTTEILPHTTYILCKPLTLRFYKY
jgi:hypothetical protein